MISQTFVSIMKKIKISSELVLLFIIIIFIGCKTSNYMMASQKVTSFPVSINGNWHLVDTLGNQIISTQFEELRLFKYGLAAAKYNGKYGYVNADGSWKIKPKYQYASDFYHNCAKVELNNKEFYINKEGQKEKMNHCQESNFSPSCYQGSEMKPIFNIDEFIIENNNKFALIYEQSKDTTEFIYDSVKAFDRDFVIVERNGKFGFFFRPIQRVKNGNVYIEDTIERYPYDEIEVTPPIENPYSGLYHNLAQMHKYRIGDRWGLIDWRQQCITEPKYISIKIQPQQDYYLVEYKQNEFGYIDKEGKEMF